MKRTKYQIAKKIVLSGLFLWTMIGSILAQELVVSGKVVDGMGAPLIGVNITVKGVNKGTISDINGYYKLNAPTSSTISFTYVGYIKQEISVNGKTKIDVVLSENTQQLSEVVAIGYGSVKRKDLTGSVSSVDAMTMEKIKPVSFESGLMGKAAGVQVTSSDGGPGSSTKIRIRGGTSINASNDPLYVIDGIAMEGSSVRTSVGLGNSSTSPLSNIDPSIIESIDVLKDASATAIYGSRGANGVIIITTKKGKGGKAELNFETYQSIGYIARPIKLLTGQQYVDYWNEYAPWNPTEPRDQFVGAFRDEYGNQYPLKNSPIRVTDWQDEISRPAKTQNYALSMVGGSEKSSYTGSFNYLKQEGVILNSDYERFSGNMRLDQNISSKLKSGVSMNASYTNNNGIVSAATENANGRSGVITSALLFSPAQSAMRYSDAEYDASGRLISIRGGDITRPDLMLAKDYNNTTALNAFGNVYMSYKLTDDLTFQSSIRASAYYSKGKAYYSEEIGWGKTANGRAYTNFNNSMSMTAEQSLTFNKTIGKHGINAVGVYEQQRGSWEYLSASSLDFAIPGVNLDNLGAAVTTEKTQSDKVSSSLRSALMRVNYSYDDRYLITFSGRADESSRFAKGKRWGYFPSAALGWKLNNESFLKNNKVISDAKLKLSYGETGNQSIGSYRSLGALVPINYNYFGNQSVTGLVTDRLPNPDLTWETTAQMDAGFTLGLFNNRISIDFDYFNKDTKDLLLQVPLPANSGYEFSFQNIGKINNKGVELSLNTVNIETKKFKWSSNINITFIKNKVLDLGGAEEFFTTAIGDNQIQNDYVVRKGESLGSVYGMEVKGIYNFEHFKEFDGMTNAEAAVKMRNDLAAANAANNTPGNGFWKLNYTLKDGVQTTSFVAPGKYRPGLPMFVNQNPDEDNNVDSNDRTIIGNTIPKHYGGFTNNFSYQNFDLSVLMTWSYGNDIYNKNRVRGFATAVPYTNKFALMADRWTPENADTDIPSIWGDGDGGSNSNAYSTHIEDGSYLRIANISVGYNLEKSLIKKLNLRSCRVYGSVDNAYVFSKYTGYDPEVSVGNNQLTPGLDSDSYPKQRTFRVGVNIGF
ncbi:MAG: TonB-dependent receptor [Paludibacter sp.]|nr:TonB-dependent receptor [Paludibacter sp.]